MCTLATRFVSENVLNLSATDGNRQSHLKQIQVLSGDSGVGLIPTGVQLPMGLSSKLTRHSTLVRFFNSHRYHAWILKSIPFRGLFRLPRTLEETVSHWT